MTEVAPAEGARSDDVLHEVPELANISELIHSTTIDGVPVLYAGGVPGPLAAGLFFRVGSADETLPKAGITHLVEHLAMHRQVMADGHRNGQTTATYTSFHVSGNERTVVTFLNDVCAGLRELPVDRLATEKEILRTEANSRGGAAACNQAIERYGSRGLGLAGYSEFGLNSIATDDVREWADRYFTTGNAVVWVTGDAVPEGLDLRLPPGARHAVPDIEDIVKEKPAYFRGAEGGVLIDAVVPRSSAASVFAGVASKVLFRELRHEGGYSYTAECSYDPVSAEHARITVYADALPEQQAAVIGGVVDVLAALRAGRVADSDLVGVKEAWSLDDLPSIGAAMLPATALNLLFGSEIQHPDAIARERETVTSADVAAVAQAVWDGAVAQLPEGDLAWAGFAATPLWSASTVSGRRFPRLGDEEVAVIIGDDGVSMSTPAGSSTVYFDRCEGLLVRPDGGRVLIGADGFTVVIEPTLYAGLQPAIVASTVDTRVSEEAHIPMPARPADEIPTAPETKRTPRVRPPSWVSRIVRGHGWMLGGVAFGVLALLYILTSGTTIQGGHVVIEWRVPIMLGAAAGACIMVARRR